MPRSHRNARSIPKGKRIKLYEPDDTRTRDDEMQQQPEIVTEWDPWLGRYVSYEVYVPKAPPSEPEFLPPIRTGPLTNPYTSAHERKAAKAKAKTDNNSNKKRKSA